MIGSGIDYRLLVVRLLGNILVDPLMMFLLSD